MWSTKATNDSEHDCAGSTHLSEEGRRSDMIPVAGPSARFGRNLAVVIGINAYGSDIATLCSPVADATAVAAVLGRDHGFETWCLFDGEAKLAQLLTLLREKLPNALGANDRLLFYFAGHGVALDSDAGPAGYLLPADARRSYHDSFLPMRVLHAELARLPVRHAFVILDCCFAGTFRWAHQRDIDTVGSRIYRERYDRYIESPAWQVLTSASSDQRAFDVLANSRDDDAGTHSPFALALLDGLAGAADYTKDNLITADELAMYVRERVAPAAESAGSRQVPQLFPLERHDCGQFVFQVPDRSLALAPATVLDQNTNPYRGLAPFREEDRALFFGRAKLVDQLIETALARRLVVVVGPSGSGKSSLVQAGLVPALRDKGWTVLPTQRPGIDPSVALDAWTRALGAAPTSGDPVASWLAAANQLVRARPDHPWLVVVDQFEELLTHRTAERDRVAFFDALAAVLKAAPNLHVVVTVRSDAEPQFHDTALASWWTDGRFPMSAMTRDELRQAIERPATATVLHFKPSRLVERLLDDVALVPAPLPLLSFALSELYRCCWARWQSGIRDRALHETDYVEMGSVTRALTQRATTVHDRLVGEDAAYATTIRNLFTRMISTMGGEVARRRVLRSELVYQDPSEDHRVAEVLQRFHDARLISLGRDGAASPYAEPTHDELVRGWGRVSQWLDEIDAGVGTRVLASLGDAVRVWNDHSQSDSYLWNDPRLDLVYERAQAQSFLLNADEARFVKWSMQRKRARRARLVGGLLTATVVLAAIAVFALWQQRRATESANSARQRLAQLYQEQGRQLIVEERYQEAVPYLLEARRSGNDRPPLRMLFGAAARHLPLVPALNHQDLVVNAAFSPDGTRVVTASTDKTARVWDVATGKPITSPLEHREMVVNAAFSPDGTRVITVTLDGIPQMWDAATGKPVTSAPARSDETAHVQDLATGMSTTNPLEQQGSVASAAFNTDRTRVVTASWKGFARVWDTATGKPVTGPLRHQALVMSARFSPDGTRVVTASDDKTACVWDAATGSLIASFREHQELVASAEFSPDGTRVVTASGDKTARVWDAATGKPLTNPLVHRAQVMSAAFSPDGARVVTASFDNTARVWDTATGQPLTNPLEHQDRVVSAVFSPDGTRVVTASQDKTARVWDAATGKPITSPLTHQDRVASAVFSPDGTRVVTTSFDKTARVWDAAMGTRVANRLANQAPVTWAALSPDGMRVVTASQDKSARVWDAATGKPLTSALEHQGAVVSVAFSSDGTRVATASEDKTARVWDAATGRPLTSPLVHQAEVDMVTFSPGGARVVTASSDWTARVWDVATGKPLTSALEHQGAVVSAAFSPDGTRVVTTSQDNTARIWNAATGEPLTGPLVHEDQVWRAAFSPDGTRVVTASFDHTARVWDAATGEPLTAPLVHQDQVASATFSPDGSRVVTTSTEGAARVWDAATGKPITSFIEHRGLVVSSAFSPDGALVVTAGLDKTARVWDAATGKLLTRPLEHPDKVVKATFTPDGTRMVTVSWDGTVGVWDVRPDERTLDDWSAIALRSPFVLDGIAHTRRVVAPRAEAR